MFAPLTKTINNQGIVEACLLRLVLYKGEVYRVPQAGTRIRVLDGVAWVTIGQKDIMLIPGDTLNLSPAYKSVISTMRNDPVTFEIWGQE